MTSLRGWQGNSYAREPSLLGSTVTLIVRDVVEHTYVNTQYDFWLKLYGRPSAHPESGGALSCGCRDRPNASVGRTFSTTRSSPPQFARLGLPSQLALRSSLSHELIALLIRL